MSLFSRRSFIANTSSGLVFLVFSWLPKASATNFSGSTDFPPGSLAPDDQVELSANLFLDSKAVLLKQHVHRITGEGHSHEVLVTEEAWARVLKSGKVVVRSSPGGGKLPHSHWVLVKLQT